MAFTADKSKIVSIFIQTLLYGAYCVVFVPTMWVLLRRRSKDPLNKTMMAISLLMFTLATMHIGINYTRIFRAFITFRDEPGGPAAYFNHLSEFTQIFGSTIYVAQTLVGDSVVLHRCYLVWGNSFTVIAFPFLLLLGSTASGIGILYGFAKVVPEAEIFVSELQQWITSFFSLTLATNVICTGLVAFRIWHLNHQLMHFSKHSYEPIMFLVIESGAIYSLTLTALLVLYRSGSWFQFVLLDAVSPIVGLVFSMIIVRIGLGITSPSGRTTAHSQSQSQSQSQSDDYYYSGNGSGTGTGFLRSRTTGTGTSTTLEDGSGGGGGGGNGGGRGTVKTKRTNTTTTTTTNTITIGGGKNGSGRSGLTFRTTTVCSDVDGDGDAAHLHHLNDNELGMGVGVGKGVGDESIELDTYAGVGVGALRTRREDGDGDEDGDLESGKMGDGNLKVVPLVKD